MQNFLMTSFALITTHPVYALNCYSCGPFSGGSELCPKSGSVAEMKAVACVPPANTCRTMKTPDMIVYYGCGSDSSSCGEGSSISLQCTKCNTDLCNGTVMESVSFGGLLVAFLALFYCHL